MSKNTKEAARKQALKEFLIGLAIAAAGVLVSYISHEMADYGERYTVYYGAIALGAIYAVKGLFGLVFPMGFKKSSKADAPAVVEEDDPAKPIEA